MPALCSAGAHRPPRESPPASAAKAGVGRRSPGHPDEVPCPFALRCPRVASRRVAQADDAGGGCPTVATVLTNPVPCFCADRRRRTGRRSGTRGTGAVPRFKLLPCRGRISAWLSSPARVQSILRTSLARDLGISRSVRSVQGCARGCDRTPPGKRVSDAFVETVEPLIVGSSTPWL